MKSFQFSIFTTYVFIKVGIKNIVFILQHILMNDSFKILYVEFFGAC